MKISISYNKSGITYSQIPPESLFVCIDDPASLYYMDSHSRVHFFFVGNDKPKSFHAYDVWEKDYRGFRLVNWEDVEIKVKA